MAGDTSGTDTGLESEGAIQSMKILCLGRKGDSRSVTLAWLLKRRGHDAIAAGMRCMGKDTRMMMLNWADLIILLHQKCQEGIPQDYWHKLKVWPVGRDVYFQGFNEALIHLLKIHMKRENLYEKAEHTDSIQK